MSWELSAPLIMCHEHFAVCPDCLRESISEMERSRERERGIHIQGKALGEKVGEHKTKHASKEGQWHHGREFC